jgi:DeoR/GlpR family transcriptional regulator of sugar metabolism
MHKYFEELKRRQIFNVAVIYAVVAWIILQVSSIVLPMLQVLPKWVEPFVLVLLLIGFPITLVFAWIVAGPGPGPIEPLGPRHVQIVVSPELPAVPEETRKILENALDHLKMLPDWASPVSLLEQELASKLNISVQDVHLVRDIWQFGTDVSDQYMLSLQNNQKDVLVTRRPFSYNEWKNVAAKRSVAAYCASRVADGDIVLIDGGTSTFEVFVAIRNRVLNHKLHAIIVITNSCRISDLETENRLWNVAPPDGPSLKNDNFVVMEVGGIVRTATKTAHGAYAREYLTALVRFAKRMRTHPHVVAFVGVTQVGPQGCAVTTSVEAPTKEAFIGQADHTFFVADYEKFVSPAKASFVFSSFDTWNATRTIVCDKGPSPDFLADSHIKDFLEHADIALEKRVT